MVFERFIHEHENRYGHAGFGNGEKTVLTIEQRAFFGKRDALMRPLPTALPDLSHVIGDEVGPLGTIETVLRKPLPGQIRRDTDDVGIGERTGGLG